MRRLRWLIPLVGAGALLALVVVARLSPSQGRPSTATARGSLTASASVVSAPSPTAPPAPASPAAISSSTPYSAGTCSSPSTSQAAQVSPPAFPFSVWENDPSGVNLRSAASITSSKIGAIGQGTKAQADQRKVDDTGSAWYHLTVGGQVGWARADYFVMTPSHIAASAGWTLVVPDTYRLFRESNGIEGNGTGYSLDTFQTGTGAWPAFLTVENAMPGSVWLDGVYLAGFALRAPPQSPTWQVHAMKPIEVSTFKTSEETGSITGCDGYWITYFRIESHAPAAPCQNGCIYQFVFVSTQADDPAVSQVIASIALDQKVRTLG
jgi:SH3 domain-containing protein